MPAKLLEFHSVGFNKYGVTYFLMTHDKDDTFMTHDKDDTFTCEIDFSGDDDPDYKLMGVLFGAQTSMVTRNVKKSRIYTRSIS